MIAEILNQVLRELIQGLITDGAHHKQYHIEESLRMLGGDDFYNKALAEFQWEKGMPS